MNRNIGATAAEFEGTNQFIRVVPETRQPAPTMRKKMLSDGERSRIERRHRDVAETIVFNNCLDHSGNKALEIRTGIALDLDGDINHVAEHSKDLGQRRNLTRLRPIGKISTRIELLQLDFQP